MNIAFLCPFAHLTIINKLESLTGKVPEMIQCTHLHCGHGSAIHEAMVIDKTVHATHEFYKLGLDDIASMEEISYCQAGGLLFREVPGAQPKAVINEMRNTEEVVKLAEFLCGSFPTIVGKGTPVDAAIELLSNFKQK